MIAKNELKFLDLEPLGLGFRLIRVPFPKSNSQVKSGDFCNKARRYDLLSTSLCRPFRLRVTGLLSLKAFLSLTV